MREREKKKEREKIILSVMKDQVSYREQWKEKCYKIRTAKKDSQNR